MPTVVDICEKQVVTLILLPLPPLKAEPKLLLRTFTDIVTALKTGVDIPLTPQMCLLIKNEEELYHLARINPKFVKNIFSMKTLPRPHVTFNFLLSIAQSKSPLVNELAYSLNCVELINNSSQFLKIAAVNLKMALNLLNFKPIEELTRGILHLIPFEMLLERYQFNNPGIKNHHLKKLKSMDLHISDPLREKTSLVKKEAALIKKRRMDMEIDLLSSRHRFMKKTFPRVAEYKNQMMFGDSGYYSKGLVTFGSGNNSGRTDFTTVPSDETIAPAFAAAFAHQLISIRTNLIAIGELSCEARFNVLECGAGNGDLCYHILNFIGKMAANYPLWEELNERIRYHII